MTSSGLDYLAAVDELDVFFPSGWKDKDIQHTQKSSRQLICQPFLINSVHRSRTEAGSSSNQSANNSGKTTPVSISGARSNLL